MSYPGTIDSFTTKVDDVDDVLAAHMNAVQTAATAIETELGTDPAGSRTDVKTRLAQTLADDGDLKFAAATELTIASGAITVTQNWHRADTEADAATDDLTTINGMAEGMLVMLRPENDARTVVIKHGTGNILCVGNADITLDDAHDFAILIYDSTLAKVLCLQGGGGGVGFSDAEGDPGALGAAADGTSGYAARRDHVHPFGASAGSPFSDGEGDPAAVTTLTPADGTSNYAARRDHAHASNLIRYVCIEIVDKDTALTTGNGKRAVSIREDLNGYNLVSVHAFNLTPSSSGNPTFQVHNLTDVADMLSTALTIDANETGSNTAATPAVINTATDDVATNDIIQIDVDGAGTGCKGVSVTLGFAKP